MGYQKIYSKSSQKYGRLMVDSRGSCTRASATSFSSTNIDAPRPHDQNLMKNSNTRKIILDLWMMSQ